MERSVHVLLGHGNSLPKYVASLPLRVVVGNTSHGHKVTLCQQRVRIVMRLFLYEEVLLFSRREVLVVQLFKLTQRLHIVHREGGGLFGAWLSCG